VHINKINGKIYVGQTHQKPENRWKGGLGYIRCCHFYRAILKYGWDGFEHCIVASKLTLAEANHFEELLIKQLNTMNPKYGYNLKSGGENNCLSKETKQKIGNGNRGKRRTKEQKDAMSRARIGTTHTEEHKRKISNGNIRRNVGHIDDWCVAQYYKNGVLKCIYNSVSEASCNTGISTNSINNCLARDAKSAGGYMWVRIDKNNIVKSILPYDKMNTLNVMHNKNNTHTREKLVNQFDKHGNLIKTWGSMTEAANALNIGVNNIWKCCNNIDNRKSAGGFIWKYTE
jgi:group I intron endonuclease